MPSCVDPGLWLILGLFDGLGAGMGLFCVTGVLGGLVEGGEGDGERVEVGFVEDEG